MVSTVAWATWTHSNPFGGYQTLTHGEFQEFHPNRIHAALPILVFANIFHHSIPELSNPVDNKLQLGSIYTTTILICFVGYLILGVVLSLFFGKAVPTSANLLWSDYSGPTPSLLQAAASAFIVIFPALDVASCFPLCAITLGNNILSAYYGEQVHTMAESKPHRVAFRLLAAAPPVLTAAFVTDLGAITRVSGICGFAIAFIFPSLLVNSHFLRRSTLVSTACTYLLFVIGVLFGEADACVAQVPGHALQQHFHHPR
jgi:amino acid permease